MSAITRKQPRLRRVKVTVEIEIPEDALADLAAEALNAGIELPNLITERYIAVRSTPKPPESAGKAGEAGSQTAPAGRRKGARRRGAKAARVRAPRPYAVRDFPHLFNRNPEGERPYRGSGRPPQWLLNLIEEELGLGAARPEERAEDRSLPVIQEEPQL